MMNEPLSGGRKINETQIRNNDIPIFHEIKSEPQSFNVQLAFEGEIDDDTLRAVKRWLLLPEYYAPLIFSENPEKIFYALVEDEPNLVHTGVQGYIEVKFRINAPHAYTSYVSSNYSIGTTPTGHIISLTNVGDKKIQPIFTFYKTDSDGDITITHLSNSQQQLVLSGVKLGEIVELDCILECIQNSPLATFTFAGSTSDTQTITIGSRVYEFNSTGGVTSGRVPIDTTGGSSATQSANAFVTAINGDVLAEVKATKGTGDTVIVAGINGVDGYNVSLSDTVTNGSWSHSTLQDRYLYDNWNGEVIDLLYGVNTLKFQGNYDMTVRYQPKLL